MYSQAEEDDVLVALLARLGIDRGRFVEIGVGWGGENNTLALARRPGWYGYWLGDEPLRVAPPETVTFQQATVTPDNVLSLLSQLGVTPPVDVFSLDIDGNDWWIADVVIPWLRPRIVIVEYFAAEAAPWVMRYTPGYRWHTGQPCGASLAAWKMMLGRDYDLVYTTRAQVNAFFVRRATAREGGTVGDAIREQLEQALGELADLRRRLSLNEGRPAVSEIDAALTRVGALVSTALQNYLLPVAPSAELAGNVVAPRDVTPMPSPLDEVAPSVSPSVSPSDDLPPPPDTLVDP